MADIDKLQSQIESIAEKLKLTEADREVADIAWKSRTKLITEFEASQEKTETLAETVKTREAELAPQGEELARLRAEIVELKTHRDQLEDGMRRARDIETLGQLSEESVRLEAAPQGRTGSRY